MRVSRRLFLSGAAALGVLGSSGFTRAISYVIDGIHVRRYMPSVGNGRPPIIMVHGGAHASWVWERWAPFMADRGWDCHVLDWHNHGSSSSIPTADFIKRSIVDVHREILAVSRQFEAFHLMGHSMGGLASLVSATLLHPSSLMLITPVVPAQVGYPPIPIPVNLSQLFPVPPFATAKSMFFSTMSDSEALGHYLRLQPESSQAVWESTRWTVSVNLAAVQTGVLVVGAGSDTLCPPAAVRVLATLLSASYMEFGSIGHTDLLLKQTGWLSPATAVENWLRAR